MNQMINFPEQLADEYSMMLLNWAYKKLGDRDKAEELVQNVWCEVFRAIKNNEAQGLPIQKMENFIWKIAHFVWCHYLRRHTKGQIYISVDDVELTDGTDFVQEMADSEETSQLLRSMRKRISSLNYLQREIMISFYIDSKSQKEIAKQLDISESTVKWHLFDTRKKLKEELSSMTKTDFVYRPRTLHMAVNGRVSHLPCDVDVIRNSLTKQNICIECYQIPRTLDELADRLGIPKAYLEFDINWLVEREFLAEYKQGYSTTFMIETAQDEQSKYAVYLKHRKTLSDIIITELCAAEKQIRSIDFYGCDKPFNQLLWLLIYRFCEYQKKPCHEINRPIRLDGGKYFPLGFDRSDIENIAPSVDTTDWAFNGPMCCDTDRGYFHWFGLYNFGQADCQNLVSCTPSEWKKMNELLCKLIHADFFIDQFDENQLFLLAKLVEKGYVKKEGTKAYPTFCIFTAEQYTRLEETVFEPLSKKLEAEMQSLAADLSELCSSKIPKQLSTCRNLFLRMALGDVGYLTTIFAFNAGVLHIPQDPEEGKLLTLLFIK